MDCPIRNAVVPVAGLGTRLLPTTKSQPKEMLPVARKPIVQYVVEEMAQTGVGNLLFVTGRGKAAIENHFDPDPALIESLSKSDRQDLISLLDFEQLGLRIQYTRQSIQKGLGDAVLHAESFVGDEPFFVALGDSIIGLSGTSTICQRMAESFIEQDADVVIAIEEVPIERVENYGIVTPDGDGDVFRIQTLVEKPKPAEAPSRFAISGRYAFSPQIFDMIRNVEPDKRGEIQLTDAIRMIAESGGRVLGIKLHPDEKRYDIGNIPSYFETFIVFALADPEHGSRIHSFLSKYLTHDLPDPD